MGCGELVVGSVWLEGGGWCEVVGSDWWVWWMFGAEDLYEDAWLGVCGWRALVGGSFVVGEGLLVCGGWCVEVGGGWWLAGAGRG